MRILKLMTGGSYPMIQHQILITNLQGGVLQQKGRIKNQILGLKGLRGSTSQVVGKSANSSN